MRLGIVMASLSRDGGGLFDATRYLANALGRSTDFDVRVFGLKDAYTAEDLKRWAPLPAEAFVVTGPVSWGYAPSLRRALLAADLDVLHVHGLWMYPSVASRSWSRRGNRPYVVTPHGMLDPWALGRSRWKKRPVAWLFENGHLCHAKCLHALSEQEFTAIRSYGLPNPVCIVPNAIHLPAGPPPPSPSWRAQLPSGAKVLLFLGRLHPKKGLLELLRGWDLANRTRIDPGSEWHLVLAGWGPEAFSGRLQALVRDLIMERVHFVGPQFGPDKDASFGAADAFVLPSFSEGLPMAVLEAWAHGLPVLMTKECNLAHGFAAGAAHEITTAPSSIARGLQVLVAQTDRERRDMGDRGRQLVKEKYSWPTVAAEMRAVYDWVLGGGQRPASVVV